MRCRACQAQNDDSAGLCFECGAPLAAVVKGTIVASRYEILRPLGKGGMGLVYLAHDRELEEPVALKILRSDLEDSGDLAKRFRSEIRLARRVAHKNVCRIFEYGQDAGRQFITMAYVEGIDLRRWLRERGPLPVAQAYDVAVHVAEALAAIHDEGIVHRDLKTQNIMLDAKGVVRVMDFGIAKDLDAASTELTAAGSIIGSPEYMSPERWHGHRADVRSDVYALGVVISELFTGRVPFQADSVSGWMWQHLHAEPSLDPLPPPLRPVVARALAKDLAQRFATAAEVARAVGDARAAPSLDPSPTGIPTVSPTAVPTGVGTVHPTPPRVPPAPIPPPVPIPIPVAPPGPHRRRHLLWLIPAILGGLAMALSIGSREPQPERSGSVAPLIQGPAPAPAQPRPDAGGVMARGQAVGPVSGTLRLSSVPPADVTIDGAPVTGSLRHIVLPPGTHVLRLETPDYQAIQRSIRIRGGEVTSLEIDFADEGIRRNP